MASYSPPTENLAIFEPSVFNSGDEPLTYNEAAKKFLKYPYAQGTENLQDTNVNGVLTANSDVILNNSASFTWYNADYNYLINNVYPKSGTGQNNTAFGPTSLTNLTTGSENCCLGEQTGQRIQNGSFNTIVGTNSGHYITSGSSNTILGQNNGVSLTTADANTLIGHNCGTYLIGDNNVSIGDQSNFLITDITTSNSTAVGAQSTNNNFDFSTALGFGATNTAANQIRLGRATENVSCPGTLSFKMTDDNTTTICYIPFSKTVAGTEGQLYVDSSTGPLTYQPSSSTLNCGYYVASQGTLNHSTTTGNCSLFGSTQTGQIDLGSSQTTGNINIGGSKTSGNINIGNSNAWGTGSSAINIGSGTFTGGFGLNVNILNGVTNQSSNLNLFSGAFNGGTQNLNLMNGVFTSTGNVNIMNNNFTGTGTINLMTGAPTTSGIVNIGNSANVNININSNALFSKNISTSNTTAPTLSRHLGYTTSKTTGWTTAITTTNKVVNSITIDGVSIAYGVYKMDVYINMDNGGAGSNNTYKVWINTTGGATPTVTTPVNQFYLPNPAVGGTFLSQTVSAYAATTFYVCCVASLGNSTLIAGSTETSAIYLTRIA